MTFTSAWFQKWKKKRRNTIIACVIVGVIRGIDYSITFATLYLYLTTIIKATKPELFYGIITAAYSCSSAMFGVISGRLLDKYRRAIIYTNITIITQVVGNIFYVISFSPFFPLFGRFLAGFGDSYSSVMTGEVVRIYSNEKSTRILWLIASSYSLGFVFGPALGIIFNGIDFRVFGLPINYTNFAAVFISSLGVFGLIIANFLVHDCSREFDLKEYMRVNNIDIFDEDAFCKEEINNIFFPNNDAELKESENDYDTSDSESSEDLLLLPKNTDTTKALLWSLFRNINCLILYASSFFFTYCLFSEDILLPLIVYEIIKWDIKAYGIMITVYGVLFFINLVLFSKICNTQRLVYIMTLVCIIMVIATLTLIFTIAVFPRNFGRDVFLTSAYLFCFVFVWFIEEVLLRAILAKMIPSHAQSFAESLRNGFSKVSTIVASLTTAAAFACIQYWSFGLAIFTMVFFLIFFIKRKEFIYIETINM